MDNKLLIKNLSEIIENSLTVDVAGRVDYSYNLLLVIVKLNKLIRELENETNPK